MKRFGRHAVAVLFVLAGIGLTIVAYLWFSGQLETRYQRRVTVMFDEVSGLRVGDPVQIQGVSVGKVRRIALDRGKVRCVVSLVRAIVPTEDTRFAIRSAGYLTSDRCVRVTLGSGPPAGDGHVFDGANEVPNLEQMLVGLERALADLTPSELGRKIGDQARALIKDVSSQLGQLSAGLDSKLGPFSDGMDRLNANLAATAGQLNRLGGMMDSLRGSLGNGSTVGRLLDTDELYQEVRKTNQQLQTLLEDIRKNPRRYIRVKIF